MSTINPVPSGGTSIFGETMPRQEQQAFRLDSPQDGQTTPPPQGNRFNIINWQPEKSAYSVDKRLPQSDSSSIKLPDISKPQMRNEQTRVVQRSASVSDVNL